jgi:hypothetical protein
MYPYSQLVTDEVVTHTAARAADVDSPVADPDPMPGVLVDLVTEHMVWRHTSEDRAAALYQLISCALDAVRWRLEPEGDPVEETSLRAVLEAARLHHAQMSASGSSRSHT